VLEETSKNGDGRTVTAQAVPSEGLFDLRLLARELWRWKWAVLLIALIGAAKGVNDARNFAPSYEAQMIVAPVEDNSFGVPGKSGGGLLGAAQSFGLVRGNNAQATSFDYYKHVIGSRKLADVLQKKYGLIQKAFKGSWDAANGTWKKPNIDEDSIRQRLRRFFHFNPPRNPDRGYLAKYIDGIVRIEPILKSPFFKIVVEHTDREFALFLLETVSREADELLGMQNQRRQARNKKYIEAQLEKTKLTEVRTALLGVLMHQEQKTMLAYSEPPYIIKILEKPWVAAQPKEPSLARIVGAPTAVATVIGLALLTLFISFRLE
jgi:hypothetical protein